MNEIDRINTYKTIEATYRENYRGDTERLRQFLNNSIEWLKEAPFVHMGVCIAEHRIKVGKSDLDHPTKSGIIRICVCLISENTFIHYDTPNGVCVYKNTYGNIMKHPDFQAGLKIGNRLFNGA